MKIWMMLFSLIAVLIIIGAAFAFWPKGEVIDPNPPGELNLAEYLPYIFSNNSLIRNYTKMVAGTGKLTDINISVIQNYISHNLIFSPIPGLSNPLSTIKSGKGNSLSLSLLEYSMLLNKDKTIKSFILLVKVWYVGENTSRNSSATLTFFGDKVFLSDVTLPQKDLSYLCRLSYPEDCLTHIERSVLFIYDYQITHAFSPYSQASFANDEQFIRWMKS
jgi:hypothetical protein